MSVVRSLGHILLSGIFITGGAGVINNPGGRVTKVAQAGIPSPHAATLLNGAVMVVGGVALAADIFPKLAAMALLGCLIPTTFVGHPYWQEDEPATKAGQKIHFMKNVAMIGGLLVVLAEKDE